MARFKPGILCLVVGAKRYFEEGIGATLRIRERVTCKCGCGAIGWTWDEASKDIPVLVRLDFFLGGVYETLYSRSSLEGSGMQERYLVPLEGDDVDDLLVEESALNLADALTTSRLNPWNCRCVPLPITR